MTESAPSPESSSKATRLSSLSPTWTLTTLRVLAVLAVVNLVWQFISAGEILAGGHHHEEWVDPHGVGAIVLHVVTGLVALAAGAHWYASRDRHWPTVVSVVVFVLTFVQAYVGDDRFLLIHIPGALVVTIGIVTVAAWSCAVERMSRTS